VLSFLSSLWLNNTPRCTYAAFPLFIHCLMDTSPDFIAWLL
jgi:hypothetical protein